MIQPQTNLKVADNTGASPCRALSKPSVLNNFQHGETPSFPDPLLAPILSLTFSIGRGNKVFSV